MLFSFRTIHGLLYTALKSLIDMDPDLYNKCEQEYEQSCLTRAHESQEREHRWQIIEQKALEYKTHHNDLNHYPPQEMQVDPPPPPPQSLVNVPEKILEVQEPDEASGVSAGAEESETNMSVDPIETVESPPV